MVTNFSRLGLFLWPLTMSSTVRPTAVMSISLQVFRLIRVVHGGGVVIVAEGSISMALRPGGDPSLPPPDFRG